VLLTYGDGRELRLPLDPTSGACQRVSALLPALLADLTSARR